MKHTGQSLCALTAAAAVVWACAALVAADSPTPESTETAVLAKYHKEVLDRLVGQMAALAQVIEKTDPASAKALRDAVAVAQKADISTDMHKVADLLLKALPGKAAATEAEVIANLKSVLEALRRSPVGDPNDRRAKLEAYLGQINKAIGDEANLVRENTPPPSPDEIQGIAAQIAGLIKAEKDLMGPTASAAPDLLVLRLIVLRNEIRAINGELTRLIENTWVMPTDKLPVAGAAEEKLAGRADSAAARTTEAAEDRDLVRAVTSAGADANGIRRAGRVTADGAGEMRRAVKMLADSSMAAANKPHAAATSDLSKADEILTAMIDRMTASTPAGPLADRQAAIEANTRDLSRAIAKLTGGSAGPHDANSLQAAAGAMDSAGQRLGSQDPNGALREQGRAVSILEGAKERVLAQLHGLPKPRPPQDQRPDQDRVAGETGKLAQQMKEDGARDPSGPMPGQQSVENAQGRMGSASGKLGDGKPSDARDDQEKSIAHLKHARDDIWQEIEHINNTETREKLASIADMLARMLETQKKISGETAITNARLQQRENENAETRTLELALTAKLSPGEANLASDAQRILDMLTKEGRSVVFVELLKMVHKDLVLVQGRLGEKDAGPYTQEVQAEIERNLKGMASAIREGLVDRPDKVASPPPPPPPPVDPTRPTPPPPPPPLLPPLAELKLLRIMQIQINDRTGLLDAQAIGRAMPAEKVQQQSKELSDRESQVKSLTDATAAKLGRR